MTEAFDVIVVGAGCAGSPLAASLAARGLRVCLIDRARFPREIPSTHMVHSSGVARLARLGLMDKLLATGAPPLDRGAFVLEDVRIESDATVTGRFDAPWLCIRRTVLDTLLLGAAEEAGAQLRTQTKVIGLVEDGGEVQGVRTDTGILRAPIVVGADGPHSVVARLTGAREYHVTPPGRMFMWAYFEGAAARSDAVLGRINDLGFLGLSTDDGLFLAGVAPSMADRDAYLSRLEERFWAGLAQIDELSDALVPAKRVGPIRVMSRWHGYFRQAAGPGWVLVGDAGHFKDPTPAQGISDALRQAEKLGHVIETGLDRSDLTSRLGAWWLWRDDDAWDMYWFAVDMGTVGPVPRTVTEVMRGLGREPDGALQFLRVLNHDVSPSALFTPRRTLRALGKFAAAQPVAFARIFPEVRTLFAEQARRRRLKRQPVPSQLDTGVAPNLKASTIAGVS